MLSKFLVNLSIAIISATMGLIFMKFIDKLPYINRIYYLMTNLILPGSVVLLTYVFLAKLLKIKEMDDF